MGDPDAAFAAVASVAASLPAVAAPFSLASAVPSLAFVGAFGVPAAGADFQPAVVPFALAAGAFARGAGVLAPVFAAVFAVPA